MHQALQIEDHIYVIVLYFIFLLELLIIYLTYFIQCILLRIFIEVIVYNMIEYY